MNKRGGLGRGLAALIPTSPPATEAPAPAAVPAEAPPVPPVHLLPPAAQAAASSSGLSWSRWMFSSSASRSWASSSVSRTIAGTVCRSAARAARSRRSPMMSS